MMFYIVWDSSFNTGIDSIDTQHRQIVDYINRLHTAIEQTDQATVYNILNQVVNYTLTHFSYEEELMKQAGYPHCEVHRAVHKSFAMRMQEYSYRTSQGEDIGKRLLADLRIWLTNHIKNDDRDYAQAVKSHLLSEGEHAWLPKAVSQLFSR